MSHLKRTSSGHLAKNASGHLVKACDSPTCLITIQGGNGTSTAPYFKTCISENAQMQLEWSDMPPGLEPYVTSNPAMFPATGSAILDRVAAFTAGGDHGYIWFKDCIHECEIYGETPGAYYPGETITYSLGVAVLYMSGLNGPAGWSQVLFCVTDRKIVYDAGPTVELRSCDEWPGYDQWRRSEVWFQQEFIDEESGVTFNSISSCQIDFVGNWSGIAPRFIISFANNNCCNPSDVENIGSPEDPDYAWPDTACSNIGAGTCTSFELGGFHWTTNLCDEGI